MQFYLQFHPRRWPSHFVLSHLETFEFYLKFAPLSQDQWQVLAPYQVLTKFSFNCYQNLTCINRQHFTFTFYSQNQLHPFRSRALYFIVWPVLFFPARLSVWGGRAAFEVREQPPIEFLLLLFTSEFQHPQIFGHDVVDQVPNPVNTTLCEPHNAIKPYCLSFTQHFGRDWQL